MPLFNIPLRIKTYSKTRNKDLCAKAAFDKLMHDDHSSRVFIKHTKSSIECSDSDVESSISMSNVADMRTTSRDDLFSFSNDEYDEDLSSKCKRRRYTTTLREGGKRGSRGDHARERVSLNRETAEQSTNKHFDQSSSPIDGRLITCADSKITENHEEFPTASTHAPVVNEEKQNSLERCNDVSSLHKKTQVLFEMDDNLSSSYTHTSNYRMEKVIQRKSETTLPCTEQSLGEMNNEQIQDALLRKAVVDISYRQNIDRPKSDELAEPQIQQQFSSNVKTTAVCKKRNLSFQSIVTDKDNSEISDYNSYFIADSQKSHFNSISVQMRISKATDEKPFKAERMYDTVIPLSSQRFNNALSCNKMNSAQENKLQAKAFVDKLSKLLAGKKTLVDKGLPCVLTTAHKASSMSVVPYVCENQSHKSLSLQEIENKDSIPFLQSSQENNSECYAHFSASSHYCIEKSNAELLPVDTSITRRCHFALPSPLAEHNYFRCLEFEEKMTDDHNYSLISFPEKFTALSPIAVEMDFPDEALQKSEQSTAPVSNQSLNTPLSNDTKDGYEGTTYSSKELHNCYLYEDCDAKKYCSVLHETPSEGLSAIGKLPENITNDCDLIQSDNIHNNCKTLKTTHDIKSCKRKSPNHKKIFRQQSLMKPMKACTLPDDNSDAVQSKEIEVQSSQCTRNTLPLHSESSPAALQNSAVTAANSPESDASDALNIGNSGNKDSVNIGHPLSKNCKISGFITNLKTDVITNADILISGSEREMEVEYGHHKMEEGSKKNKTKERHSARHAHSTVVEPIKTFRCVKTEDNDRAQGDIDKSNDNYAFSTSLSSGSETRCDTNYFLNEPNCLKKAQEKVSSLSQHTQKTVRRLLKSPLKMSIKAKAAYDPRQWLHTAKDEELANCSRGRMAKAASAADYYEYPTCDNSPPLLSRVSSWPKRTQGSDLIKVRVSTDEKPLFTVVRNVKEAHECQEYGEKQEFQDDVDYILDGLQSSQPLPTRCLSTLSLASKCMVPAFRMHLRAHGILIKILEALHDAPDFMSLSLCLSAFFFTMSHDRLALELDDFSVRLILRLLHSDSRHHSANGNNETLPADEKERIRIKVFDICTATIHSSKTPYVKLKLDDMTTGYLGLEILLSLTSKHTTDWLKETLRSHGGLKYIIKAACHSIDELVKLCPDASRLYLYVRSEKCLKVLDNVTYMCTENQSFVLEYESSMLIDALNRLLIVCVRDVASEKEFVASDESQSRQHADSLLLLSKCFLTLLRLLLNITHDSERGCFVIGQQEKLLLTVLSSVLNASATVCTENQFDLSILGLSLLTNLVENCDANWKKFSRLKTPHPNHPDRENSDDQVSALQSLGLLFSKRLKAAQVIEEVHDAKLEAAEKQQKLAADSTLLLRSRSADIDESGEWVESELGLQWVAKEEKEQVGKEEEDKEQEVLCTEGSKAYANRLYSQEEPSSSQCDADNYTKDLHTAGRHMEDNFVAAYTAVLIGCVIQHDMHLAETVRHTLPEFSFTPLVRMIRKFLGFMNFTTLTSASGSRTFQRVLTVLESCRANQFPPLTQDIHAGCS